MDMCHAYFTCSHSSLASGGVPANAGGIAAGFLSVLPSPFSPRHTDTEHTDWTGWLLGTCCALRSAALGYIIVHQCMAALSLWVCAMIRSVKGGVQRAVLPAG